MLKSISLITFFSFLLAANEPTIFTTGERLPKDILVKYRAGVSNVANGMTGINSARSFIKSSLGAIKMNSISHMNIDSVQLNQYQNLDKA
ncbi:hypothetical protein P7A58_15585, partial [Clostridium perfringens]|nr:hypothetical protein [Clostridium perfringens]